MDVWSTLQTIVTEDDAMEDQVGQLTAFSSADGGYCGISFELISSQSHHLATQKAKPF